MSYHIKLKSPYLAGLGQTQILQENLSIPGILIRALVYTRVIERLTGWVSLTLFVLPLGFEPRTYALEVHCSILLSYGGIYVTRSTESLNGHRRLSCHKFFSNFYEIPPFCSLSKTLNNTAHKQSFLKRTFRLLSAS